MAHVFYLRGRRGPATDGVLRPQRWPVSGWHGRTRLPLFAASSSSSFSQSNDIPEGGTGELLVATATGHQPGSETCSREGCRFSPRCSGSGVAAGMGWVGGADLLLWSVRGEGGARAMVGGPRPLFPLLRNTSNPHTQEMGLGEGGGGNSLCSLWPLHPLHPHPVPCRASARGSPEMPTSLRPLITPSSPCFFTDTKASPMGHSSALCANSQREAWVLCLSHSRRCGGSGPRGTWEGDRRCRSGTRDLRLQRGRGHRGERARRWVLTG